nr:nitronate monooxygenase [Gammaproteobacteria bacterium]
MTPSQQLLQDLNVDVPLICGAMYPCSNPELVAAVSEAGAMGVVQPMSLSFVHGYEFREGLRFIRSLTKKPIGLNLILETSSKTYRERTEQWASVAAEEGVKFFVTALGNPSWVVELAQQHGITVYHDVTNTQPAQKALDAGVDGFIAVNANAGGHAGTLSPEQLLEAIAPMGKPIVAAGGIGNANDFKNALTLGYAGTQLGTRFIATHECSAHQDYKAAIVAAQSEDIVLTERLTGVPVAIINTPYIQKIGTKAGPLARWMLKGRKTKHWMRTIYSLQSVWKLKKANLQGSAYQDYWQAGKSAGSVVAIESAADIVRQFAQDQSW